MARQVVGWLRANFPDLRPMRIKDCQDYVANLQERYSPWSVHHYLTKLRVLLDQAVEMGMISENPARSLKMGNPKTATVRRLLNSDEARNTNGGQPEISSVDMRWIAYSGPSVSVCWSAARGSLLGSEVLVERPTAYSEHPGDS